MFAGVRLHIRRHRWFYLALTCGAITWFASRRFSFHGQLAVAGDTFYFTYLVLIASLVMHVPTERFRDWLDDEDEGVFIIVLITLAAVAISLFSIFSLLNAGHKASSVFLALSLASAPLSWLVLHTVFSLRYAHMYYLARALDDADRSLAFPGTDEPGPWDFIYYSFVVGMTAQVSDVQVLSTRMRRLTILHGLVSFMFNTVLIAIAVNTVVTVAQAS